MNKNNLATRLKNFRKQKGMSQELLAEESGLSLRTIQRIEKGETNPNGESLKRIANALNVTPDELVDWSIKEDKKFLTYINLSALTFIPFPLLGILIPFILWSSKKGKIKDIDALGKRLINFEITWTLLLFFVPLTLLIAAKMELINTMTLSNFILVIACLYLFNLVMILFNTIRISNDKQVFYAPQIKFLK